MFCVCHIFYDIAIRSSTKIDEAKIRAPCDVACSQARSQDLRLFSTGAEGG